ncbi:deoxyribodipyrimidine photo-lyase [Carnobacterium sp. ISL-102]|uniref:cryptochrome/photolyase family protein n=1 Tax=Carnobacterium sp. ISL-102 TaxID=2819142 RepID=UPI001BE7C141|nr:deoxyribodipyrimidine photo-lyase [Carnobacterium sp. ISL-102]MBT2732703.1 deoxyribodipyrimidine photo-lyase [Carnobacterium sp. ISL-102]
MVAVMWFRRDLRVEDNTALKHALEECDSLILLFHVNSEQLLNETSKNEAAFFKSVETFRKTLDDRGVTLHLAFGDLTDCFTKLKKKFPEWTDIYVNRDENGYGLKRDILADSILYDLGIRTHAFHDHYLHSAHEVKTNTQTSYKVFTPYFNKWKEYSKSSMIKVDFDEKKLVTSSLFKEDKLRFESFIEKHPRMTTIKTGSAAAKECLDRFVENNLQKYDEARDYPSQDATSHLSHHLRTGEISIRTVYDRVSQAEDSQDKETFIKELAWRDFYNMIYTSYPNQKNEAINPEFGYISWYNNEEAFDCWKEGKTGFPIIDAAMRQLKETGWIHNRLRMITASFLTKDLLIDWRWGERHFQEHLIDYDSANNIGGWQWASSTGADSAPYFRIFNPTTQSERFDKEGLYIKQYVPELRGIDNKKIHDPSKLSVAEQDSFGVIIGSDYPAPIVSHKDRRKMAIELYELSKEVYRSNAK